MQTIQIQTAQNVFIEYQPAGVGDRILAYLIDGLVKVAYGFVVLMLFVYSLSASGNFDKAGATAIVIGILLLLPLMFYTLALEIFMDGQTIGKQAMNVKVVKLDGSQPSVGAYLIRWLLRIVDISAFYGIVAIISIASSKNGQRLGDMAANTTVITLKRRVSLQQTRLPETPETYEPQFPQVTRLTDRDVEIVKETLQAYQRNGQDTNLLASLSTKLKALLEVQSGQADWDFLQTILKDYTHIMSKQ